MEYLTDWVLHFAHTPWSVVALFVLAFAESSFFPIPPDILLIAMGLMTPEKVFYLALICTIGSVIGGLFGYAIGRFCGRPIMMRFFSESKIMAAEAMYQKYDVWAIGVAAFTPIPYKVFTVTGGMFELNLLHFTIMSILGRGGRFFLVAALLFWMGESVQSMIVKYANLISLAFVVLLVGGFIVLKLYGDHHKKKRKLQTVGGK